MLLELSPSYLRQNTIISPALLRRASLSLFQRRSALSLFLERPNLTPSSLSALFDENFGSLFMPPGLFWLRSLTLLLQTCVCCCASFSSSYNANLRKLQILSIKLIALHEPTILVSLNSSRHSIKVAQDCHDAVENAIETGHQKPLNYLVLDFGVKSQKLRERDKFFVI